jgi:hypothetical protein
MTNTTKAGTTTINQTTATIGMEDEPDDNFGSGGSPYTIALLPGSDAIDAGSVTYPATDQRGIARDDGQGDIGAHEFVLADAVRAPKATPPAGAYDVAPNVALSTATLGADIYYTLNGDDPTVGGATQYIAPIPITGTTLIKAAAWNGAQWSRILEAGYTLFTAMPEANPSAGSYWEAKEIELSAADGAVIYYTLDGSEPDRSATLYTSPILLNTTGTHTLKAIAYLGDSRESAVMTAAYDITVPDVIEVSSGIELDAAINSASLSGPKKIILMNDVDAVASSTYSNSPRVVIDGNGYAINGRNQNRTSLRFGGSGTTAHVTVRNATLRNMATNLSYGGGALGVYIGSLTVENCAFIGNSAYGASGSSNGGGAVCAHNSQTSLKVSNSTFYGNETGGSGGAILSTGTADVVNCTITGNMSVSRGAGVSASSATNSRLYNSIVVGNRVSDGYTGTDVVDSYNFTDMGYNIRGTVNTFRHPTSASGKTADEAGIKAGPPEASDSLGGSPYIIALLPGSPAIDAADPDVDVNDVDITRDQRGVARDENPDIGAYEYEDETPPASGGGNGGGGGSGGGGNGSGGGPSDPGSGNGGDDEEPPISAGIVDPPISATTDPDVEIGGNAHNVTDGELGGILDALPGDRAEALGGATSSGASGGIVSNPGEVAGGLSELDKAELDAGADAMIPLPVFKAEVNDGRTVLVSMAVSLSKFAGNNLSEVAVLKYRCDGVTERLEPAASPEGISHARYAWTDANGAALSGALKISAGRLYYLSVAIKDDSVHDWDPTPGSVVDPMALALVKSAANGGNDEASSGGSGGCDAGFGLLGLAALAGLSVFARRARAR